MVGIATPPSSERKTDTKILQEHSRNVRQQNSEKQRKHFNITPITDALPVKKTVPGIPSIHEKLLVLGKTPELTDSPPPPESPQLRSTTKLVALQPIDPESSRKIPTKSKVKNKTTAATISSGV